ncbi:hypothetical protein MKW92_001312 [Papaver armeniacum]|nr:hypothetical protein MKW92_001312 [Papaver armeniacum]
MIGDSGEIGSGFPTGRGTEDGHLEAHHDLQARPARPGKATRLGVRGSLRCQQKFNNRLMSSLKFKHNFLLYTAVFARSQL